MTAAVPLTADTVLTQWVFDPLAVLLIFVAGSSYAAGIRRLSARDRSWSQLRAAAFAGGLVTLFLATSSAVAAYDTVLFSMHVVQHVLLGIVGPLLLALGAPVTLLLQASTRPTQVNVLRVLHSRPVRTVGHPLVTWLLFGLSLFVLYFSPIYEWSLRSGVVHAWVHLHFVVVGSLFFWVTVGIDPAARRIPHGARLLLVLLTVPFHAFLGVALLSAGEPFAASYYAGVARDWGASALDDQRTGAALMWLVGDLVGVVAGIVIAQSWFRHDRRRALRLDRRLDAEDDAAATLAASAYSPERPVSGD